MRSTQFYGLNDRAKEYLENNANKKLLYVDKVSRLYSEGEVVVDFASEVLDLEKYPAGDEVLGMFEEKVHTLQVYKMRDGSFVEEYIQAEPWSSGPMIFLALRDLTSKEIVEVSLWADDEM